jgi:hypothetical protein
MLWMSGSEHEQPEDIMAAQTFTVTHPNGKQETRNSKARGYTHAVVLVTTDAEARAAKLDSLVADAFNADTAEWLRRRADRVRAAGDGYRVVMRWSATEAAAVKAATTGDLVKDLDPTCQRLIVVPVDAA